jgi:N-acetylneuraminic acid mutarotase
MTMRYVGLAACFLLAACGSGGGGSDTSGPGPSGSSNPPPVTTVSVSGAVQKGPFLVGSTVLVNKLNAQGQPTDSTIVTEIQDSIGSFSFSTSTPGPVQIVASGYYFSELTGNVSNGSLTLKALYNVGSASTQTAYVNILTHLINGRVLDLVSGSQLTLSNAIAQAEREFLDAFSPALPVSGYDDFSALSLYNVSGTSDAGNAYLLALSTGFYKYAALRGEEFGSAVDAELTLILNQISDDLRDDGQIQHAGFIDDFINAIRTLSPTEIAANLRRRSIADYPAGLDVPDISRFLNQCAGAAECAWSNGAPLPAPSRGFAAVPFGEKLYLFGGVAPADFGGPPMHEPLPTAHRWTRMYDPVGNTWTAKSPMPAGGTSVHAHVIGDKIYVFPGHNLQGFSNEVLEYDPLADTWAVKTPAPSYRYTYSSAAVNGKVYLLGGFGTADDGPPHSGQLGAFKSHVEIYDPATDTWSTGQAAPGAFADAATCSIGNDIYMIGGENGDISHRTETWVYHVITDSWSAKSPLPTPRARTDCVRVGDLFYVFGGLSGATVTDSVGRYDPATDSWTFPTRMREPRDFLEGAAMGSKIFLLGGYANGINVDTVDILDTAVRLP